MDIKKTLSTLAIIATISVPILFANQAQARDRYYHGNDRYLSHHGNRDAYRHGRKHEKQLRRHERKHQRRHARRHYQSHYNDRHYRGHYYRGHHHKGHHHKGHHQPRHHAGYRRHDHHSALKLIFRF